MSNTRTTDLYYCERRHIQRKPLLTIVNANRPKRPIIAHRCDICGAPMKATSRRCG